MAKVLIIDDSKLITLFGKDVLSGVGHEVITAEDGESGIEKAKKEKPDVILLDVIMPGIDGYEVCQRLKADPDTKDIAIIMFTSRDEPTDKIKGLELGAQDYVTKPFDPGELIARVNTHVRLKELYDTLEEKNRQLAELANKDGLTGLYNHRTFQELLAKELSRAKRFNEFISLLFLDVDNFKRFNDTYGHLMGDQVLRSIAQVITKSVREMDTPARYGGEEFAVILPGADEDAARKIAERIRKAVESIVFKIEQEEVHVTVSIGVASFPGSKIQQPRDLIECADQAVYAAKEKGRNRVEIFHSEDIGNQPSSDNA